MSESRSTGACAETGTRAATTDADADESSESPRLYTAEEHAAVCSALLSGVRDRVLRREPDSIAVDAPAALGRVTARSARAGIPLPPFDNSQMDGYAVLSADLAEASLERPVELPLGLATAAGDAPVEHRAGTASPVMTGAVIPNGADAVVPIEESLPPVFPALTRAAGATAEAQAGPSGVVGFAAPVLPGRFVRGAGSDLASGSEILGDGTRLTPTRIGALAAAGAATVPVRSRARVLLCSTGDEIHSDHVEGDAVGSLPPGRIHDANTPMLAAAFRAVGAEVRVLRSEDRAEDLRAALATEWEWADVIVTSGGISAGAFEVVREALEPLGATFRKVAMQPGGPQGYGRIALSGPASGSRPVLCFPGNPVSAILSAELFLLPTLRELAGLDPRRTREQRPIAHDADSPKDKLQLRRARIADDGRVLLSGPSSHLLAGFATADVIAEIPLGIDLVPENTSVTVWRIHD